MKPLLMLPLLAATLAAVEIPRELTDERDRATYRWLLQRCDAEPHVERDRKGQLAWIGFEGESKYTCSLTLDDRGRVTGLRFNKLGFRNDELETLAGFRHVTSITCLHNFDEEGPNGYREGPNPMSGEGWLAFKDHPLERFFIAGCNFDGRGLLAVAHFPQLVDLGVFHTRVGDEDLKHLAGHLTLESIYLGPMWGDRITGAALEPLAKVPNFKRLRVVETFLAFDGGFEHLLPIADQIESLDLGNCVIPPADLERLPEAFPNATIEHDGIAAVGQLIRDNWKGANRKLRRWAPEPVIDTYAAAPEPQE